MTNHLDMYLFIQMSYSVNHLYKMTNHLDISTYLLLSLYSSPIFLYTSNLLFIYLLEHRSVFCR